MSFSIGANDAANGLATSYGSGAWPLRKLVVLGAVAEFFGAMFCSDKVAATLSTDIVPDLGKLSADAQVKMMFSVCLSSFLFIMSSSFSGMPISGTHTVIGALLGGGIMTTNAHSLAWPKLYTIALSWVISPAMALVISYYLMKAVISSTLESRNRSFSQRIFSVQHIASMSFVIIAGIISSLTGSSLLDRRTMVLILCSGAAGFTLSRVFIIARLSQSRNTSILICFFSSEYIGELCQ